MRLTHGFVVVTLGSLLLAGAARAEGAAEGKDKLICKKELEVGSLAKKKKRCFTRAEWEKIAEVTQRGARRTVQELQSKTSSN